MKQLLKIFICAILAFSSCTNVLEITPKSQITKNNAWQKESDVNAEIHGVYALIRKAMIGGKDAYSYWWYGDFRFRDIIVKKIDNYVRYLDLKSDYYSIEPLSKWEDFYTAIVQCNLILENAINIPENKFVQYERKQYIAEAHFLRAFLYFYMSRVWGDVPLQKKAINHSPLPREKMDVVLNFAIDEVKAAINDLPWEYEYEKDKVRAVRATRGAAYTLLSQIYMWNGDDENALAASKVVLDNLDKSHYDLLPIDQSDDLIKGRSVEGIFEIDFDEQWDEIGNRTIANLTLCKKPWLKRPGYWDPTYIHKDTLASLFPEEDPDKRRELWFQDHESSDPMIIKFKNVSSEEKLFEDNIIVFRLAGLYLLRAEGLVNTGKPGEAIALLNKVRNRAEATPYSESEGDLKTAIVRERRKELIGEGHVWYDMLRNGYLLKYRGDIYDEEMIEQGAWTWPINKYYFNTNGLLRQYPFWL